MRRLFGGVVLALALVSGCMALGGCAELGLTGAITGASQTEQVNLRIMQAADVVVAADATVGQQLDKGLITAKQAGDAKAVIDKARAAVNVAKTAAAGGTGNTTQLLAAMDALILQVLQAQAQAK